MIILFLAGVIAACIIIWKASDYFEEATDYLGRNMREGVKGATLNAIASSMPELITSFIFLFFLMGSDGYAGTIGTTAGSAVFNSLIIPGFVILIVTLVGITLAGKKQKVKDFSISRKVARRDGLVLIGAELALILTISGNKIGWLEGLGLIAIYAGYMAYTLLSMKKGGKAERIPKDPAMAKKSWTYLTLSVIIMTAACWGLVYCVEQIGEIMGIPLMFVSIILAAAASSVPDTIISIKDARKGNYDDAVSNALGSNIFDICIAHGLPLFLYAIIVGPVVMTEDTTDHSVELRVWLLILTAVTIPIYAFTKKITWKTGVVMFLLYGLFIAFVVGRALDATWAVEFGDILNIFK